MKHFGWFFNRIYFVKNRDVSCVLNAGTLLLKCIWFKGSVMSGWEHGVCRMLRPGQHMYGVLVGVT